MPDTARYMPKMLFVIVDRDRADAVTEIICDDRIPLHYRTRAQGTASSETLDMLGLGRTDKSITVCMGPNFILHDALLEVSAALRLKRPGRGIAFTVPVSGISNPIYRLMQAHMCHGNQPHHPTTESEVEKVHTHSEYELILAVINRGYTEELMDAARGAGARGGTVVHARRMGDTETLKSWGISVQEERELVYIVAHKDVRVPIMKAINKACGLTTEAQGYVFSLPVDSIEGIGDAPAAD